MRSYSWILVWAVLAAWSGGCRKHHQHLENSLQGYWELRSVSTVTIAGLTRKDYPSGNGIMLRFNGSSYEAYANGQLLKRGLFRVEDLSETQKKNTCLTPDQQRMFPSRLVFNTDSEIGPFRILGDSLSISSPCIFIDAAALRVYKKISVAQN